MQNVTERFIIDTDLYHDDDEQINKRNTQQKHTMSTWIQCDGWQLVTSRESGAVQQSPRKLTYLAVLVHEVLADL